MCRVKKTAPSAGVNLPLCVCVSDVSVKGVDEVICWINVGAASHSDDVSDECYTADVRASLCKYSRVKRPHKG